MSGRLRNNLVVAMLALAAALAACEPGDRARRSEDDAPALEEGRARAGAWLAAGRAAGDPSDETVIALGYLERLRLGFGSPFRLMEYAAQDPRLAPDTRRSVGRALLARTVDGQAYQLDPRALNRIRIAGQPAGARAGSFHTSLINGAVTEARDPRSGELAVRLAYALSAAERTVSPAAVRLAAQAAALVRDRELARDDARRLVLEARERAVPPLSLLGEWRSGRRFVVERPAMQSLPPEVEREALELAPVLAASIREQGPRLSGGEQPLQSGAVPLLGAAAARRLAEIADSLNYPDQTPFAVAVDVHRPDLVEHPALGPLQKLAGERFTARATNEERFAGEYALLLRAGRQDPAPSLAAMWAAVAMRPYGQEPVWFPGFDAPSTGELVDRYGLAALSFDDAVPPDWRPYYRRMLSVALRDLQSVIPSLDLRGVRVRFGHAKGRSGTLALHDPKTRTVYLPPATGAGTIAHELAHDVDWQISLRRYRVRGDYGTDRAVRRSRDRLAASLQGLTSATLLPPTPGDGTPTLHARRPAEVFARNVDWFVAVSLASDGRSNGYLSSVQDDLLTGFGTVLPPDISGSAGAALIAILDEVAPVYSSTRDWFLSKYGPGRVFTPYDLLRQVLEGSGASADPMRAPEGEHGEEVQTPLAPPVQRFGSVRAARDSALTAIDAWVCRAPGAAYDRRLEHARRDLVLQAASARARGVALERARAMGGPDAAAWMVRQLYGAGWDAPPLQDALREPFSSILEQVRALESTELSTRRQGFHLAAPSDHCASDPLAFALS